MLPRPPPPAPRPSPRLSPRRSCTASAAGTARWPRGRFQHVPRSPGSEPEVECTPLDRWRTSSSPPLIQLLSNAEFDIRKEAAWAISNAIQGGTPQQIKYLVEVGCIRPLCDLLTVADARIITVALEGLENILKVGHEEVRLGIEAENEMLHLLDEATGLAKIDDLQGHASEDVRDKATAVIETYFPDSGVYQREPVAVPAAEQVVVSAESEEGCPPPSAAVAPPPAPPVEGTLASAVERLSVGADPAAGSSSSSSSSDDDENENE